MISRHPIFRVGSLWVVSDEAAGRDILRSPHFGRSDAMDLLSPLLGDSIFVTRSADHDCCHSELSRAIDSLLGDSAEKIRSIVAVHANQIAMTDKPFDLAAKMVSMTEEIVLRCLLGVSASADLGYFASLRSNIRQAMRISHTRAIWFLASRMLPGLRSIGPERFVAIGRRQFERAVEPLRDRFSRLPAPSWLSEEINAGRDELLALYVSATEKTAAALTWIFAVLGGIRRMEGEFGEVPSRPEMFVDTVLSAFPPVPSVVRTALIDTYMPDMQPVYSGETVLIRTRGAGSLAFGSGRRRCLGERLARMVMSIAMEEFGRRFRLETSDESNLFRMPGLVSWPRRVVVKAESIPQP